MRFRCHRQQNHGGEKKLGLKIGSGGRVPPPSLDPHLLLFTSCNRLKYQIQCEFRVRDVKRVVAFRFHRVQSNVKIAMFSRWSTLADSIVCGFLLENPQ